MGGWPNSLACWLALGKLNGAGHSAPVEPPITVNTQSLTGVLPEFGGTLYGFEEREKSFARFSGRTNGRG